jgi:predicted metal-binding membrane protein
MSDMMMPNGSMMWMRMPGQTWLGAATAFLGMWTVMMAAMMLPSLVPTLIRYRRPVVVGLGYFFVWTLIGALVFPLGVAIAAIAMPQPRIAIGLAVLIGASLQLTEWKARRLDWCRTTQEHVRTPWRHGLCLGIHCAESCAGLMAILLVVGVMDLRAMGVVTAAITVERFAPNGVRVARAIGGIGVAAGLFMMVLAAGI